MNMRESPESSACARFPQNHMERICFKKALLQLNQIHFPFSIVRLLVWSSEMLRGFFSLQPAASEWLSGIIQICLFHPWDTSGYEVALIKCSNVFTLWEEFAWAYPAMPERNTRKAFIFLPIFQQVRIKSQASMPKLQQMTDRAWRRQYLNRSILKLITVATVFNWNKV